MGWLPEALAYSLELTRRNVDRVEDFPEVAVDGRWAYASNRPGGWVGGHWTGLLWLAYAHTADPAFEAASRAWSARLAPRQDDTGTHDLGFLFGLSHVLGAHLTGDESLKRPALAAARSLTCRYNPAGRFIRAWGALGTPSHAGRAIVDTMMNLDLLYWATEETGRTEYATIATSHARTAFARQVRPDWSTAHVMDFDPETGAFLKQDTHQGLSATSCWARGQAWAVYGFAECYRHTGEPAFLAASRNLAAYCLRRLPEDLVPFWDYDSPLIPNDVRDSSAAAALASGLLLLAGLETDAVRAGSWRSAAETMLRSLWESYSSRGTDEPAILLHATRNKPAGSMDTGLIYGDYYFVEGLTRLIAPEKLAGGSRSWQGSESWKRP